MRKPNTTLGKDLNGWFYKITVPGYEVYQSGFSEKRIAEKRMKHQMKKNIR